MTKTQVCAITSGISSIAITGIIGLVIVINIPPAFDVQV